MARTLIRNFTFAATALLAAPALAAPAPNWADQLSQSLFAQQQQQPVHVTQAADAKSGAQVVEISADGTVSIAMASPARATQVAQAGSTVASPH
jgi:hypothetical protein